MTACLAKSDFIEGRNMSALQLNAQFAVGVSKNADTA